MIRERRSSPRKSTRRRPFRLIAALAASVLVVVVLLAGVYQIFIESNSDDPATVAEEGPSARTGSDRTYIEADVGFPETLNPLIADSYSEQAVASLLFRGLFETDSKGDPIPDLAADWSVTDDGLSYVVELDPDTRWHDGEPFTAADVLFTLSLVKDPEFPGDSGLSRFWRAISVQQDGDHTIEFELLEPYSGFLHYLNLPILPRHELSGILPSDLTDLDTSWQVIGTGAYALESVDDEALELHFELQENGNQSEMSNLTFRYYQTRDDAVEAFRAGEVDGLSYVPLSELHEDSRLPSNSRVYAPAVSGYTALYFNVRHPQFRDVDTRRAIEAAIDREAIVETVLAGQAIPGTSPIPSMLSAHDPGEHGRHNPQRARELLASDGWEEDDEGLLQRDGERFIVSLIVNGEDQQRVSVASAIQEQLREVGIVVDVQALTSGEVQQALNSRQFAAALFGWHTETGDPDCYQMWHSSQAEEGLNFTGFADSEADKALMSARHSVTIDERNQYYSEFQEIFAEQVPAVVVFYPRYHFAVSAKVDGAEPHPLVNPSDRVRQIPDWYIVDSPDK